MQCSVYVSEQFSRKSSPAVIAQLGERKTEDLKVSGSIPDCGNLFSREQFFAHNSTKQVQEMVMRMSTIRVIRVCPNISQFPKLVLSKSRFLMLRDFFVSRTNLILHYSSSMPRSCFKFVNNSPVSYTITTCLNYSRTKLS